MFFCVFYVCPACYMSVPDCYFNCSNRLLTLGSCKCSALAYSLSCSLYSFLFLCITYVFERRTYIARFVLFFEVFGDELDSFDRSDDLWREVVGRRVRRVDVDVVGGGPRCRRSDAGNRNHVGTGGFEKFRLCSPQSCWMRSKRTPICYRFDLDWGERLQGQPSCVQGHEVRRRCTFGRRPWA